MIIKIYIVYDLEANLNNFDPTLKIMTLISTSIVDIVLHLIQGELFYFLMAVSGKM